ncbi:hypothetical protein [Microbacterium dextranolyticum]|uniref:Uncharacterized protein n=1 Tax=Microbacterium dextranolyticum TaxID=36806 RepID=A0A9W6HMF2_9MICO|nr:hypothetical protein [Microbacterium dextranolyticum]MBM7464279.1 hypothetical protein [Microbacterium dextranolyticum]GLJ95275.1 hypothetical protein GCM10017591_13370 [Microbacterium dextranolyticum]
MSETATLVWAQVEAGFYVASLPGVFVGCVERTSDGRYLARDGFSNPLGTADELAGATELVTSASTAGGML